ncbi:MAG: MoaD/ThiS family protein [Microscillaceae bacterium]|nr:MoaD/ThiS family protein [Microscillaceae bacterium]
MAKVIIPTPLRKFAADQASFVAQGNTVGENIQNLTEKFPGLKEHLLDEEGKLRQFIKVYVADEDIEALDNEQTAVNEDTIISIIPAIAGGSF